MSRALPTATSVATLCLASIALARETIDMWVRAGTGKAVASLADAYDASHENQVALTEVARAHGRRRQPILQHGTLS